MALSESSGGPSHAPLVVRDSAARGAADPRRPRARPARRHRRARTTCSCAAARSPSSARPARIEAPAGAEVLDGEGRHLFPGFVDPHVHLRTPGQEHKEDLDSGHPLGRRRRLRRGDRDAEHRPDGRLGAGAALAARGGAARGARAGRLPRLRHHRPRRRRADRDGRAARRRRARLHRRRQARAPRRDAAARAAVPAAVRRRARAARGGPVAERRTASCTRARCRRGSGWPASPRSRSRR